MTGPVPASLAHDVLDVSSELLADHDPDAEATAAASPTTQADLEAIWLRIDRLELAVKALAKLVDRLPVPS